MSGYIMVNIGRYLLILRLDYKFLRPISSGGLATFWWREVTTGNNPSTP